MNIAISGKICSGKTTVAKFLQEHYGFYILNFGGAIKQLEAIHREYPPLTWSSVIFDYLSRNLFTDRYDIEKATMFFLKCMLDHPVEQGKNRPLLQAIGQGARDYLGDEIWIDFVIREMLIQNFKSDMNFVIDDLRYQNEAKILRDMDFQLWRIDVSEEVQRNRVLALYGSSHLERLNVPGEVDLDDYNKFDWHIDGDKPLGDEIKSIYERMTAFGYTTD